jgi:hypothetical protein
MTKNDKVSVVVALVTAATTVGLSMVLNSWAFTATLDSWFGHTVGVLLPLWVLALTYQGHRFWHEPTTRKLAYGCFTLAGFALVVSLPHLANGYRLLGLDAWECWSLALVTDLTQVACKLGVIALVDKAALVCVQNPQSEVATEAKPKRASRKRTEPKLSDAA